MDLVCYKRSFLALMLIPSMQLVRLALGIRSGTANIGFWVPHISLSFTATLSEGLVLFLSYPAWSPSRSRESGDFGSLPCWDWNCYATSKMSVVYRCLSFSSPALCLMFWQLYVVLYSFPVCENSILILIGLHKELLYWVRNPSSIVTQIIVPNCEPFQ